MASLAILTRIMSAKDYGTYALWFSMATALSTIFFQWLCIATGRFYPVYRNEPSRLFCTVNRLYWIVVAVTLAILAIVLMCYRELVLAPSMIVTVMLIAITQGRFSLALQLTNACGRPMNYGLINCTRSIVTVLASAAFVYFGAGAPGALYGALIGFGVASILFVPSSIQYPAWGSIEPKLARQLFRYGLPFTLTLLAIMVVDVADRFLINKFLGVEKVAPYASAYDFTQQSIGVIINVLFLAGFPSVVNAFESGGVDLAKKHMESMGRGFLLVGPAAVAGLGVLSKDVSQVLFGKSIQQEAALIIPWISIAIMIAGFKSYYLDIAFQVKHSTRFQSITAVAMAVINIILNLILIPSYGIIGAAWATLIAFTAGSIISAYFATKIFPFPNLWNDLWKSILAVVPMVVTLSFIPPTGGVGLALKIFLGGIIYLSMAWILNCSECRDVVLVFMSRLKGKDEGSLL